MHTLAAEPLLTITGLDSGYGKIAVLRGVDLVVGRAEIVTLLGPDGAGKTTLLRAISGLLPVTGGNVQFDGRDISNVGPREASRAGLAHVIEGHRVFSQQTVADNLLLAAYNLPRSERVKRIEEALEYFPEIAAKRQDLGSALSGGQQQMLAVAQGLVRRPKLLLLDVDRVLTVLGQLKASGTSVLLVEQLVDKALAASGRVYAMVQGRIALAAPANEQGLKARLEAAYLGGHQHA